jgi:hypothetical protein
MTPLRCVTLLLFATTLALGQSAHPGKASSLPNQPEALVRSLYTKVVARHPTGISIGVDNMKVFATYLSKTLLQRIDLAMACDDDWVRQHPDPNEKPPGLEGGLFTGDDLRAEPQSFHIETVQAEKDGSVRVYVKLTHAEPNESPWFWRVAAIVIREDGHFVVDDVIYLKDRPQDVDVRLSEYLSDGCDGARWVGHSDKW